MNDQEIQLVEDMNRWGELKKELDSVESRIKAAVLEMEETQGIGDVEATFVKPEKKYDYEGAVVKYSGDGDPLTVIKDNTTTSVNWYKVCNGLGIGKDFIECTKGDPKVRVKLR